MLIKVINCLIILLLEKVAIIYCCTMCRAYNIFGNNNFCLPKYAVTELKNPNDLLVFHSFSDGIMVYANLDHRYMVDV